MSVGGILEPYDADRAFPFYGFGGIPKYMGLTSVNHCFPLTGNVAAPDIFGIQNVMGAYAQTLSTIELYGPTLFGPVLTNFLSYVKGIKASGSKIYNVLMILTDGEINDMPESRSLIVDLSNEPCSVIIVGVGSANFNSMNVLDGDNGVLCDP